MMQEVRVVGRSAGEGNGNHSSILAWEIPWTEEPGGLQSMGSQRVRYNLATKTTITIIHSTLGSVQVLLSLLYVLFNHH